MSSSPPLGPSSTRGLLSPCPSLIPRAGQHGAAGGSQGRRLQHGQRRGCSHHWHCQHGHCQPGMGRAGRAAQGARRAGTGRDQDGKMARGSGGGQGARLGTMRGRRWHGENTTATGAMRVVGGGSGQGARSRHVSLPAAAAGAGRAAAAARGSGRAVSAGALLFCPVLPRLRRRRRASSLESVFGEERSYNG